MSPENLIDEYAAGRMSRRALIRRLVAGGVSLGAAVSYAHLLGAERAKAAAFRDEYGFIGVKGRILDQDLDRVIREEKLRVRLWLSRRAQVEFRIILHRPELQTGHHALIGEKTRRFDRAVTKKDVSIPLAVHPPHSVDALRNRQSADLALITVARRGKHPKWGAFDHQRTLFP